MPNLSKRHAEKSHSAYQATLDWGLRMVLLVGFPAAIALCLLAGPILTTLFNYGQFNGLDVLMAQRSMWAFSFGVPAFMMVKVLASAFYARQNIKTPVKVAIIALIVNMLLNFSLIQPLQHAGLALSTTCAALVNASILWWLLARQSIFKAQAGWFGFLSKLCLANAMLAVFLWFGNDSTQTWLTWPVSMRVIHLTILVMGGIFCYFFTLYLTRFRWKDIRPSAVTHENYS